VLEGVYYVSGISVGSFKAHSFSRLTSCSWHFFYAFSRRICFCCVKILSW